ncbi:MAG: 50S ribosomal protein L30 [Candidatus Altiarchaeota archaeon]|nr:50S ribosomal protein L30 [Candidatus Altiarchaeota archaeon]
MTAKESKEPQKRLAIVRVRGSVHQKPQIKTTCAVLKLKEPNHCVLIDSRPEYRGMITLINDYVTWGEINPATLEKLLKDRGKVHGGNLTDKYLKEKTKYASIGDFVKEYMAFKAELKDIPNFKQALRLNPPRKGFERLGIKKPYSIGGVLGYRGDAINALLERMI